jgi:sugar (pentulose or hexulose) kinase
VSDERTVRVGIDLGTGSARAFAVAEDGAVVGRGSHPLRSRRDGDRHEQDPGEWWDAVGAAGRAALRDVAAERVRGVATCATSGTVLLVDRDGRPRTAALMYDDARAGEQARDVGLPASWGLPKLLSLLALGRRAARGGARLAHAADVVTRRLVGGVVPSD